MRLLRGIGKAVGLIKKVEVIFDNESVKSFSRQILI